MRLVALIHTVPTVYSTFGKRVIDSIPDTKVTNTVDEYLASDPAERGVFTPTNKSRLFSVVKNAEATGADVILTTCSTLSPIIDQIRGFFRVPLVTIDGAMVQKAVEAGTKIGVVATADSTLGPTTGALERAARDVGKAIEITTTVCPDAYIAIKSRDTETHDQIVLRAVESMIDRDVIVLAQASMAHLEEPVSTLTRTPVLSSPRCCIEELEAVLGS